jgi:hypothetical protein
VKDPIRKINILTSLLWAAAILASAILKAPNFLTLFLLPMLAAVSILSIGAVTRRTASC